ncbi:MAG: CBS domain-containing protein [Nitrososphaerales archaeon]|jgi:signal-transduction protein with cAMP-binding, CBS, and nucleotidyltransferase domain
MTKWECYRCGHIFEGEVTPDECPNCHYSLTFWLEASEPRVTTVRNFVKTDPPTIDANESVLKAAQKMRDRGAGNILVLINGEAMGILTERDILNRIAADDLLPSGTPVRRIMTSPVISIGADAPLAEAVKLMAKHRIRTLFVTDNGRPFGLLNMRSIMGDQFRVAKNLES